ncbi:MAG: hypothetical protein K2X66_18995 [Cyanobacteria bacterium]|nr:hypothetical protein [Cyanobacteriota bacterium]
MMMNAFPRFSTIPQLKRVNQPIRFGQDLTETELKEIAKQTTAKASGSGISGRVYYENRTNFQLSATQMATIQQLCGSHPAGYGFFDPRSVKQPDNTYLNTWNRSTSCD